MSKATLATLKTTYFGLLGAGRVVVTVQVPMSIGSICISPVLSGIARRLARKDAPLPICLAESTDAVSRNVDGMCELFDPFAAFIRSLMFKMSKSVGV